MNFLQQLGYSQYAVPHTHTCLLGALGISRVAKFSPGEIIPCEIVPGQNPPPPLYEGFNGGDITVLVTYTNPSLDHSAGELRDITVEFMSIQGTHPQPVRLAPASRRAVTYDVGPLIQTPDPVVVVLVRAPGLVQLSLANDRHELHLGSPRIVSIVPQWKGIFLAGAGHTSRLAIHVDKGALQTPLKGVFCGRQPARKRGGQYTCEINVASAPTTPGRAHVAAVPVYAVNQLGARSADAFWHALVDRGFVNFFVTFVKTFGVVVVAAVNQITLQKLSEKSDDGGVSLTATAEFQAIAASKKGDHDGVAPDHFTDQGKFSFGFEFKVGEVAGKTVSLAFSGDTRCQIDPPPLPQAHDTKTTSQKWHPHPVPTRPRDVVHDWTFGPSLCSDWRTRMDRRQRRL